jgi:hypothetical protein
MSGKYRGTEGFFQNYKKRHWKNKYLQQQLMQIRDLLQLQLPVGPGTQFARIQVSRPCNAAQRRIFAEISFGANTPTFPYRCGRKVGRGRD